MQANSDEMEATLKRIDEATMVKGTILFDGKSILRCTMNQTTAHEYLRVLEQMTQVCSHAVREHDPADKINFMRIDWTEAGNRRRNQIMVGIEDEFRAIVLQEYKHRNLRVRDTDTRSDKDYMYVQQDPFFPKLDNSSSSAAAAAATASAKKGNASEARE